MQNAVIKRKGPHAGHGSVEVVSLFCLCVSRAEINIKRMWECF